MPAVHVLCRQETLDPGRLAGQVVVVVDILFATSTIVHAFHEGARTIWPAISGEEANLLASRIDGPCLRAAEYLAKQLPGFAACTPLSLSRASLRDATLVYSTTNGTVTLRRVADAAFVYAGALLNGAALVRHIVRAHPGMPVLLVCSGSAGHFNLEDFYGAGHFARHFSLYAGYDLNDAAIAARLLCENCDPYEALLRSHVGRLMQERSFTDELQYVAQLDLLPVVAQLRAGRLERIAG